jgi:hypothetical protein
MGEYAFYCDVRHTVFETAFTHSVRPTRADPTRAGGEASPVSRTLLPGHCSQCHQTRGPHAELTYRQGPTNPGTTQTPDVKTPNSPGATDTVEDGGAKIPSGTKPGDASGTTKSTESADRWKSPPSGVGEPGGGQSRLSTGAIIGIAISSAVAVLSLFIALHLFRKRPMPTAPPQPYPVEPKPQPIPIPQLIPNSQPIAVVQVVELPAAPVPYPYGGR